MAIRELLGQPVMITCQLSLQDVPNKTYIHRAVKNIAATIFQFKSNNELFERIP